MLSILFAALVPVLTFAQPIDLLALKATQTTGSVERAATGETVLSAGFFSVAAIYQQMAFKGKSFDMTATFTRTRGTDGIGFVFPVGDTKVAAVFGGWNGRFDGLNRVDELDPSNAKNPTQRKSKVVNGDSLTIKISVRPDKVTVLANGQPHFEVDPRAHKLSVVSDIDKRFQDGVGIYVVNGDVSAEAWTIEEVRQ